MQKVSLLSVLAFGLLLGAAGLAWADEYRLDVGLTTLGGDAGNLEEIEGAYLEGQTLLRRQFFSVLDVPLSLRLTGKSLAAEDATVEAAVWRARAGLGHSAALSNTLDYYSRVQLELIHVQMADAGDTRAYPHGELSLAGALAGSPWELGVLLSGSEEDADRFPVLGRAAMYTGLYDRVDWGLVLSGSHERVDLALSFRWY